MTNISRLKKLAGLIEAEQVEDPDEVDRKSNEQRAREAKVVQAIAIAFKKIGLSIAEKENVVYGRYEPNIIYFEDSDREANVVLDDTEADLDVLMKLKQTGLSNKFSIIAHNYELEVTFKVAPEIDNVVLPQTLRR